MSKAITSRWVVKTDIFEDFESWMKVVTEAAAGNLTAIKHWQPHRDQAHEERTRAAPGCHPIKFNLPREEND